MADLARAVPAADAGYDTVGCQTLGLVADENALRRGITHQWDALS